MNERIESITKKLFSRFLPASFPLGIEIGTNSIKMALLKQDSPGSARILDYAILSLKNKATDEQIDPGSVIKNIVKEKKLFIATEARLTVSGTEVDAKRITLPFMPKEEIGQALRYQAKEHFLFNIDESMLDFEILKEGTSEDNTKTIEVIAYISRDDFLDKKLSFFKDAELPPTVVITKSLSLYNLYMLNRVKPSAEPAAIVDIGESTTTITIIKENKISFIRQFGCAGRDFTNAMAGTLVSDKGKLDLSLEMAERLKKKVGIPEESTQEIKEGISANQITSLLRPVVEKLATEIKRSLDYYVSQYNEGSVTKLILSGGTSKLKNIDKQLSERLSVPVEVLSIPKALALNLPAEKIESFKEDFAMLVPAIGVALSKAGEVNLIPDSYKGQTIKKIQRFSARIIFIIISLILFASYLFNSAHEKVLKRLVGAKQPQWEKLQEVQSLHSRITQKNSIINQTLKNQVTFYNTFKVLSSAIPQEVYLESMLIKEKGTNLTIKGVVLEVSDTAEVKLTEFINSLEDS
ncbi:MAG: type IV pilus assembly protein PilM, partial [Candidatus Omnitrophica bacterium]|nr:type IV pilus assembly protein PilM [Candidatus Omnitrophota bacterium]